MSSRRFIEISSCRRAGSLENRRLLAWLRVVADPSGTSGEFLPLLGPDERTAGLSARRLFLGYVSVWGAATTCRWAAVRVAGDEYRGGVEILPLL